MQKKKGKRKKKRKSKKEEEPSNVIILNLRFQLKTHSKIKDLQSRVKNKGLQSRKLYRKKIKIKISFF